MNKKSKKPKQNFLERLLEKDADRLLYRVIPRFLMEIANKYFRVEIEGLEFLPKHGPIIFAPNHSGVTGFDAMILAYEIGKRLKRKPIVLTHHLWFLTQTTAIPAKKLGFVEATYKNGVEALKKKQAIIIFPEGEAGNFKVSSKSYVLQEFRRGFVRLALETKAPIVPTLVIGAEETHINLKSIRLTKYLRGLVIPLPLNIIPLPSKWKIIFMEPISLPFDQTSAKDRELVCDLAMDIQEKMQSRLQKELR